MSAKINIPEDHPRYKAMMIRHNLIKGCEKKIVAPAGLIAQGRGEAFDYLIGEKQLLLLMMPVKLQLLPF